jgi:hypothetical protein
MSASACGKHGAASEHDTNSQSSDLGLLVQWAVDEATVAARVVVEVLSGTSGGVGGPMRMVPARRVERVLGRQ